MRFKRLPRKFYTRPTLIVAKELLGKYLARPIRNYRISNGVKKIVTKKLVGKIVETEAYIGPKDRASHAYGGKITERCKTEYLIGGHIYIYLCYGMYWQLNITTEKAGKPECVLIRALEPIPQLCKPKLNTTSPGLVKLARGPGKLCQWLKLNGIFNEEDLVTSKRIWLAASIPSRRASPKRREDHGEKIRKPQIVATKRIGIDYAGIWAQKPWRLYLKGNPFVSRK